MQKAEKVDERRIWMRRRGKAPEVLASTCRKEIGIYLSVLRERLEQTILPCAHKRLHASHPVEPRVMTVDTNAASPKPLKELKAAGDLVASCELRQSIYLKNLIEQDHRFIKRLVKPGLGFFFFETAWRT